MRRQLVKPKSESPAEQDRGRGILHPIRERVAIALFAINALQSRTMQDKVLRASYLTDLVDLYRLEELVSAAALNGSTRELVISGLLISQDLPDEEQDHDFEDSENTSGDQCYASVRARQNRTATHPACINHVVNKSSSWYRDSSN